MSEPLHVVDSSGWIEYFTASPNAEIFAAPIEATEQLIVASISVLEVFRWVLREHGETDALRVAALMQQGRLVDLDTTLALRTVKLGIEHNLPMADSILFATARGHGATLWTQDSDFEDIPGVEYHPKRRR